MRLDILRSCEARNLDRIVERHVLEEIDRNPVGRMLEPAVSPAVAGDVGRRVVADRQGRRAPQVASVVVAQIERLARTIGDRIVRPRGELVLAAVHGPGVAAAFGRHLKAEGGVGDDVDPGRRRRLARAEDRHIFPSVLGEAAEPVEELEVRQLTARPSKSARREPAWGRARTNSLPPRPAIELIGEPPALSDEHHPRHRREKGARLRRDQVGPQHEDAARRAPPLRPALATGSCAPRLSSAI